MLSLSLKILNGGQICSWPMTDYSTSGRHNHIRKKTLLSLHYEKLNGWRNIDTHSVRVTEINYNATHFPTNQTLWARGGDEWVTTGALVNRVEAGFRPVPRHKWINGRSKLLFVVFTHDLEIGKEMSMFFYLNSNSTGRETLRAFTPEKRIAPIRFSQLD